MATVAAPGRALAHAPVAVTGRFVLPKLALACIVAASALGVSLTTATHGGTVALGVARWLHLAAVGLLAGGAMWLGLFVRPPAAEDHAAVEAFVLAARRRFRLIACASVAVAAVTLPHLARLVRGAPALRGLAIADAAALVAGLGLAVATLRPRAPGRTFDAGRARAMLAAFTLVLVLDGLLDAGLGAAHGSAAWVLRPLHLVAFGLWLGGAVWNIFVAVPAARETLGLAVVVAAAHQLERFRAVVRVVLPTLVVTGFLQAYPYTGLDPAALVTTTAGHLILGKILLVTALFAIFVTCPMWRGCSPIRGMCDLDDLDEPAPRAATRRLDNRGKACGGFVHVRAALHELPPGGVLELLSSDVVSWNELPRWLARRGFVLLHRERQRRLWRRTYRYLIEKPGATADPDDKGATHGAAEEVPQGVQAGA